MCLSTINVHESVYGRHLNCVHTRPLVDDTRKHNILDGCQTLSERVSSGKKTKKLIIWRCGYSSWHSFLQNWNPGKFQSNLCPLDLAWYPCPLIYLCANVQDPSIIVRITKQLLFGLYIITRVLLLLVTLKPALSALPLYSLELFAETRSWSLCFAYPKGSIYLEVHGCYRKCLPL